MSIRQTDSMLGTKGLAGAVLAITSLLFSSCLSEDRVTLDDEVNPTLPGSRVGRVGRGYPSGPIERERLSCLGGDSGTSLSISNNFQRSEIASRRIYRKDPKIFAHFENAPNLNGSKMYYPNLVRSNGIEIELLHVFPEQGGWSTRSTLRSWKEGGPVRLLKWDYIHHTVVTEELGEAPRVDPSMRRLAHGVVFPLLPYGFSAKAKRAFIPVKEVTDEEVIYRYEVQGLGESVAPIRLPISPRNTFNLRLNTSGNALLGARFNSTAGKTSGSSEHIGRFEQVIYPVLDDQWALGEPTVIRSNDAFHGVDLKKFEEEKYLLAEYGSIQNPEEADIRTLRLYAYNHAEPAEPRRVTIEGTTLLNATPDMGFIRSTENGERQLVLADDQGIHFFRVDFEGARILPVKTLPYLMIQDEEIWSRDYGEDQYRTRRLDFSADESTVWVSVNYKRNGRNPTGHLAATLLSATTESQRLEFRRWFCDGFSVVPERVDLARTPPRRPTPPSRHDNNDGDGVSSDRSQLTSEGNRS